jgi:hypothetical protein
MLASTVQFSNNDQPPITPKRKLRVHRGRQEGKPHGRTLRHPTTCPTPPNPRTHVPRRSSTNDPRIRKCRIVNVPPMSNQHRTLAGVLAP